MVSFCGTLLSPLIVSGMLILCVFLGLLRLLFFIERGSLCRGVIFDGAERLSGENCSVFALPVGSVGFSCGILRGLDGTGSLLLVLDCLLLLFALL